MSYLKLLNHTSVMLLAYNLQNNKYMYDDQPAHNSLHIDLASKESCETISGVAGGAGDVTVSSKQYGHRTPDFVGRSTTQFKTMLPSFF